jgi:hypothetical protein
MGCQLNAGRLYEIGYTNGSLLVIALTEKWYNNQRDGEWDGDRCLGICRIDNSSIRSADKEIPFNYNDCVQWLQDNNIKVVLNYQRTFSKEDFEFARDFISQLAKTDLHVGVSM